METQNAKSPIAALISQFELQTRLFNNVLENITDEQSSKKLTEDTNHLSWLTGHVLSSRYMLANVLGLAVNEPHAELFSRGKGLQKGVTYPSVNELQKEWNPLSEKLLAKLNALGENDLAAPAPFPLPMGGSDIKTLVSFMSHHEAYTIGQMGILRRFNGLPGMKYN